MRSEFADDLDVMLAAVGELEAYLKTHHERILSGFSFSQSLATRAVGLLCRWGFGFSFVGFFAKQWLF